MARKIADLHDILHGLNVRYPALEGNPALLLGSHYFAFPTKLPYHTNKWPIRLKLVWHIDGEGPTHHAYGDPFMLIFSSGGHAHRIKWTPWSGWEISMNYNATHDGQHRWLDANNLGRLLANPHFPAEKCKKARAVLLHILKRAAEQKGGRRRKKTKATGTKRRSGKVVPLKRMKKAA